MKCEFRWIAEAKSHGESVADASIANRSIPPKIPSQSEPLHRQRILNSTSMCLGGQPMGHETQNGALLGAKVAVAWRDRSRGFAEGGMLNRLKSFRFLESGRKRPRRRSGNGSSRLAHFANLRKLESPLHSTPNCAQSTGEPGLPRVPIGAFSRLPAIKAMKRSRAACEAVAALNSKGI